MKLTKKDVQKRLLRNGKPLALSKFSWDEKTRTFSSAENGLVIDFSGVDGFTIKAGNYCTITAGSNCTITAGSNCTVKVWPNSTITVGHNSTITVGYKCVIVRRDMFEVILPEGGDTIKTCPFGVAGYLIKKKGEYVFRNKDGEVVSEEKSK